jgi:hypothetical protein
MAGAGGGEACGEVFCVPPLVCCNPLQNLCTRQDEICLY